MGRQGSRRKGGREGERKEGGGGRGKQEGRYRKEERKKAWMEEREGERKEGRRKGVLGTKERRKGRHACMNE